MMKTEYKSYKELGSDSIAKWAAQLDVAERREMTKEEGNFLFGMTLNEKDVEKDEKGVFDKVLEGWNGISIIYKRLQLHSFTMSKAAMVYCGFVVESPGEAVMMLNYFQYRCFINKIKHVDMNALGTRIMPMGWFSKDVLQEFWERQKYVTEDNRLANMLDNPKFGSSICLTENT